MAEIHPDAGRAHRAKRPRGHDIDLSCRILGPQLAHDGGHFVSGHDANAPIANALVDLL
jgi:hypothetical protein